MRPSAQVYQYQGSTADEKICKYAQQNSLFFIPASIPLPQPSFHYLVLSIVCKPSSEDRKDTIFSFLSISYIHKRQKKLEVVIYLYSSFHQHKLGWGSYHPEPTLKVWQYKNTLLFSCITYPTPSRLYILYYKSHTPKFGCMYICWMVKVHEAWQLAHFGGDLSVLTIAVLHKVKKRPKIKLMIKIRKQARSYIKP